MSGAADLGPVCIIPARGGSKRIPRKNIAPFHGRPMISWSIRAALDSGCFARVIVSTDDDEIAEVANICGAEVPFRRPAELSDDHTPTLPVIVHAMDAIGITNPGAAVCCIYATAPFLRPDDLRQGFALLQQAAVDYVFSVTSFAFPIQRALRITPTGRVAMFQPEHALTRSQDLEEAWHDAGQLYWGRAAAWRAGRPIFGADSLPLPLPRHRVQDIDTPEDWARAEWLFRAISANPVAE